MIEIGQKLAKLEQDRDRGKPGAQERLEYFRRERKGLVDSITQVGSIPLFRLRYRLMLDDTHETELHRIGEMDRG